VRGHPFKVKLFPAWLEPAKHENKDGKVCYKHNSAALVLFEKRKTMQPLESPLDMQTKEYPKVIFYFEFYIQKGCSCEKTSDY